MPPRIYRPCRNTRFLDENFLSDENAIFNDRPSVEAFIRESISLVLRPYVQRPFWSVEFVKEERVCGTNGRIDKKKRICVR